MPGTLQVDDLLMMPAFFTGKLSLLTPWSLLLVLTYSKSPHHLVHSVPAGTREFCLHFADVLSIVPSMYVTTNCQSGFDSVVGVYLGHTISRSLMFSFLS